MTEKEFTTIIEKRADEYVDYTFGEDLENAPAEAVACVRGDFLEGAFAAFGLLLANESSI